jgi:hypothetical protein
MKFYAVVKGTDLYKRNGSKFDFYMKFQKILDMESLII